MKKEQTKGGATELNEEDLEKVQGGGVVSKKAKFSLLTIEEQSGTSDSNPAPRPFSNMDKARHNPVMATIWNTF